MNATMEADPTKAYNQDDATGFIRLNGLRLKVAANCSRQEEVSRQSRPQMFQSPRRELWAFCHFNQKPGFRTIANPHAAL